MASHPAMAPGRVAVVTGAANGIGLAACERFAGFGMRICMADVDGPALDAAAARVRSIPGAGEVLTRRTDVGAMVEVQALQELAYARFGEVGVLFNNAGRGRGGGPWKNYEGWQQVLQTNLWGVINGVHAFAPAMIEQGTPALIVNTGSKQGITCPPGDTAYNVSKAGIKVITESLQHELRNTPGCRVSAHLLVPGFTYTSMMQARIPEKPAGAWTAGQVIDELVAGVERGDFYIICPDNEVSREMDRKRILWAAGDLAEQRPPLSRWHPDYKEAFERFDPR